MNVDKATAAAIPVPLYDLADPDTLLSGVTPVAYVSLDGGAESAITGTPAEIGTTGVYAVPLSADESDGDAFAQVRLTDPLAVDSVVTVPLSEPMRGTDNAYTGTPPTADAIGTDAASKILATPGNKLATDGSGNVVASNFVAAPSIEDLPTNTELADAIAGLAHVDAAQDLTAVEAVLDSIVEATAADTSWVTLTEASLDDEGVALGPVTIGGQATAGVILTAYRSTDTTYSDPVSRTTTQGDGGFSMKVPPSASYVLLASYDGVTFGTKAVTVS
jgi:hypothetical protein